MPKDFDNRGTFALFRNKDSDENPERKWPPYKGTLTTPDGQEFWISAYVNESDKVYKGKFFAGRLQPKESKGGGGGGSDDDESLIPF